MENPINILVVEDDTNINNLLKSALEKAGYQVIQAFSGTEAELVLQMQKSVSLVLLDLMLPGISGEEVLKSIRKKGKSSGDRFNGQRQSGCLQQRRYFFLRLGGALYGRDQNSGCAYQQYPQKAQGSRL